MLIRIFIFHLVTLVVSSYGYRSVDEMFQWLRSIHLKDSANNQTVSNKPPTGEPISRIHSAISGVKILHTGPQTVETLSSTTGRVTDIGDGNGEVREPYQDFTQPQSSLLNYLFTWKGDSLPFTPDSVMSTMTSETTVTSVSSTQTDVISSSDGMSVDQWHKTLMTENGGERAKVTLANSEDTSKTHTTEEEASSDNEERAHAHILNSIEGRNSTSTFQKSRLHDMISMTKLIIVTVTVSCAVIVILILIFGISSCRKRKEVQLRDAKANVSQRTDSIISSIIPDEDKDSFMGIPSNNQIWKELQIIEKSAANPSVN